MDQPPFHFQFEHVMRPENKVGEEPVILPNPIHGTEAGFVLVSPRQLSPSASPDPAKSLRGDMHLPAPSRLAVMKGSMRDALFHIHLMKNVFKDGTLRMTPRPCGEDPAPNPSPMDRRINSHHYRALEKGVPLALMAEEFFIEVKPVIVKHEA